MRKKARRGREGHRAREERGELRTTKKENRWRRTTRGERLRPRFVVRILMGPVVRTERQRERGREREEERYQSPKQTSPVVFGKTPSGK